MFGIQNYGSFILAILVFQAVPGPGTLAILNATARHGVGFGMGAVFGTLAGDFVYMLAAVLGLATILNAWPGLLEGAQWIGIAYLCWLGLKLLLMPTNNITPEASSEHTGWTYTRQAFAVCLTNPKVIMFFMAFFPLFLKPGSRPTTLAVMMAHVTTLSLLYQTALVLVGNAVAQRLNRWSYARKLATRLAGVALIGFGVKLALNQR